MRNALTYPLDKPRPALLLYLVVWKLSLLVIAFTSPGLGYDTSTRFLVEEAGNEYGKSSCNLLNSWLLAKLVRWDAIYFIQIAKRGAIFEQEWAFGWGFARLLTYLGKGIDIESPTGG
ncbi:MAG: hypothetical protein Q9214_000725 [Letrouitia sp. 1 TL-2023]